MSADLLQHLQAGHLNTDDIETTVNQQPVIFGNELEDVIDCDTDIDIDTMLKQQLVVSQTGFKQEDNIDSDIDTESGQLPVLYLQPVVQVRMNTSSHLKAQARCPLRQHFLPRKNSKENLDRFIPNRSAMDFDYAHLALTQGRNGKDEEQTSSSSPTHRSPYPVRFVKPCRHIPKVCIISLLDWGRANVLAIAIGHTVYLWDASSGSTSELVTIDEEKGPVTSINWAPDGRHLAVGLNNSEVQLWDSDSNPEDIEGLPPIKSRIISVKQSHPHNGRNGRKDCQQRRSDQITRCGDLLGSHSRGLWAQVANLLATGGGGEEDRTIKFWNTHTGACLNLVDNGSQVCSLLWSKNERELLSSHGLTQNQLTLWRYPSMVTMAELTGHTSRVRHMAQSPDGCTVASAAGDETLMFWNVFGEPETAKKPAPKSAHEPFSQVNLIR
ncbi:hypothetical protein Bca101_026777 [Brassica carinata]